MSCLYLDVYNLYPIYKFGISILIPNSIPLCYYVTLLIELIDFVETDLSSEQCSSIMQSAYCVLAISSLEMHSLVRFDRTTGDRPHSTAKSRKKIREKEIHQ